MGDGELDNALDDLYAVAPDGFTAARAELATRAKRAGETDAAKRISAARRPTTAAWIVNLLAIRDAQTRTRLDDLGGRLRAAHHAMDGDQIRQLSAEQRRLVDDLAREAFQLAGVTDPSTAVRNDVVDTLQAAVADREVAAALGRLAKAEHWDGFGGFGAALPEATPRPRRSDHRKDLQRQRHKAEAVLASAERALTEAEAALSTRQDEVDDARHRLEEAERALRLAEDAVAQARRAGRDARVQLERL